MWHKIKTRIYKIAFLFILLNPFTTLGQSKNKLDFIFKFHPLTLISIPRPTVQGSIELKYNKTGIDMAYGQQWNFPMSQNPDIPVVKNYGNRFRLDLKHYFNKPSKHDSLNQRYVSLGYSKIYSTQNITTNFFSGAKYEPGLAIKDNIHVISVNYGICNYFKNFVLETNIGTGIRFRTTQEINSQGPPPEESKKVLPHLSLAFKVGYIF